MATGGRPASTKHAHAISAGLHTADQPCTTSVKCAKQVGAWQAFSSTTAHTLSIVVRLANSGEKTPDTATQFVGRAAQCARSTSTSKPYRAIPATQSAQLRTVQWGLASDQSAQMRTGRVRVRRRAETGTDFFFFGAGGGLSRPPVEHRRSEPSARCPETNGSNDLCNRPSMEDCPHAPLTALSIQERGHCARCWPPRSARSWPWSTAKAAVSFFAERLPGTSGSRVWWTAAMSATAVALSARRTNT